MDNLLNKMQAPHEDEQTISWATGQENVNKQTNKKEMNNHSAPTRM